MEATKETTYLYFANISVDCGYINDLTYGIEKTLYPYLRIGSLVEVYVKNRLMKGVVLLIHEDKPSYRVLKIERVLSSYAVSSSLMQLAQWMSTYYATPLSKVLMLFIPSGVKKEKEHKKQLYVTPKKSNKALQIYAAELRRKFPAQAVVLDFFLKEKKGIFLSDLLQKLPISKSPIDVLQKKNILKVEEKQLYRCPLKNAEFFMTPPKKFNAEQQKVFDAIKSKVLEKKFSSHLIFGVTSCGKTEIYLQLIRFTLDQKQGVLFLIPEISLTPQTIERVKSRFQEKVAVIHSKLSDGERLDAFHAIYEGKIPLVIGARSALFTPIPHLGLILVDEEHDSSYKQQEKMPCYHGRDVAIMRGFYEQATVVLGSATPSLESRYNAEQNKFTLHTLTERASHAKLPKISMIDMHKACEKAGRYTLFSQELLEKIEQRYNVGEQTILFLNRRGFHTSMICTSCNYLFKCTSCDLSLTFHKGENILACHLCDYKISPPPSKCPECHQPCLKYQGYGTEQVQKALHAIFPQIRSLRVDKDTTTKKGSHHELLHAFKTIKADLLIGTQMVIKGLHFPQVTLVGILNPDSGLLIPDFRVSETLFQQLIQASGRSGRGSLPGEVLIQTFQKDLPLYDLIQKQSYSTFYNQELLFRKEHLFPPFTHLIKCLFWGKEKKNALLTIQKFRELLIPSFPSQFTLLPIVEGGYSKVKDHYRFQFLIKGPSSTQGAKVIKDTLKKMRVPTSIKYLIDVDPQATFF